MAAVYVSNIVINAGATFSQTFDLESSENDSAFNLTDYTVSAQMRKYAGSSSSTTFTSNIVSPGTLGKIIISLTASQTTDLKPGRYQYDVIVTDTSSTKTRVIEGTALVREGVTR